MLNRTVIFIILLCTLTAFGFTAQAQNRQLPFSAKRAAQTFNVGQEAYLRGDLTTAIRHFKTTLKSWPVHQKAWHWLTAAYQHLNQVDNYQHALFFRERTAWALDVDLRHARRIFDDVANGRLRAAKANAHYATTAQGLIDFYDYAICRVQRAREAALAKKLSFNQKYGLEKIMGLAPDPKRRQCWPLK